MSDKIPKAKVYVWRDPEMGETGKPWKVGLMGWGDILIISYDAYTYAEAWEWLYANYIKDAI